MEEMALNLPEEFLLSDYGFTKSILRDSMKGIVPNEILYRKDKVGLETSQTNLLVENKRKFRVLIQDWSAKDSLVENKKILDYFDKNISNPNRSDAIWRLINYAAWYNIFINR